MAPSQTYLQLISLPLLLIGGDREQRLQLLFYLSLSPKSLTAFLNCHPGGGLPTWLMEVGNPIIISLASLSHYYIFGRAFCPRGLDHSSAKKRKCTVNASAVLEWTSHILSNTRVEVKESRDADFGSGASVASAASGTNEKAHKAGAFRARRGSGVLKPGEDAATLMNATSFGMSAVPPRLQNDSALMRYLQAVRDGRTLADQEVVSLSSVQLIIDETTLWSMDEFVRWADEALDDNALHSIFYRLVGAGVFPIGAAERELVQVAWKEWQTSDIRLWSEGEVPDTLELFSHSVRDFFVMPPKDGEKVKATSPPWGGIGGFDGKGGLGYGIMYCIDRKWWDDWTAYVGWSWEGGQAMSTSTKRPGDLSSESLLNRMSDLAVAGTLGSYEIMKENLRKDIDYILVPPGVWDVLYEMYAGGPPLPRMVLPPQRTSTSAARSRAMSGDAKQMEYGDESGTEVAIFDADCQFMRIPDAFAVATHPWILHCSLCDPAQPYRRGDAGSMSIRIMATPDQPLWRLYAEILTRLPVHNQRAVGNDGRGKARLWKHINSVGQRDAASRYGPWVLLCKNRSAILPILDLETELDENFELLKRDWQTYTDKSTVEGCGLSNGDRILFEHSMHNKNGEILWPREAAAKAGHAKRLADEDLKFRLTLKGLNEAGEVVGSTKDLVGMLVDAMDFSGRWYQVEILEADHSPIEVAANEPADASLGPADTTPSVENGSSNGAKVGHNKEVKVDFSDFGGHEEWIDVNSDRLAFPGRFTVDKEEDPSAKSNQPAATDPKAKTSASSRKTGSDASEQNGGKICTFPGYGACGLANLGNTCYANSAIQCISYMPLLRSYLLSAQYKAMGDLNKDNPLGTGGKLLEEFAELLRTMWSGKFGERSPTRFRGQLGKQRTQFSGSDQQDAQELLNYMLDVLHEDSNKVKKKPYVEALDDEWVKRNSLPRVGDEAWRRFLRRNRSIMGDVAMGQVLNTVTCPVCQFSSRNFDPFNLLSIPFPTVADVIFQCTVVRRATPLNCPTVLNLPRKNREGNRRYNIGDLNGSEAQPPSERLIFEEYVIPMSRLADIGDLRLRLQNVCGIAANRLRLCKAEEIQVSANLDDESPVKTYTRITPLPDKEGPCIQVAKNAGTADEVSAVSSPPTRIFAFEHTLSARPMPQVENNEDENQVDDDTVTEDEDDEDEAPQEGKVNSTLTAKDIRTLRELLRDYGDGKECRIFDTDPLLISKAISRSLWPTADHEFKLGLRVDAIDHRNHWFPGSVVEIMEGVASEGPALPTESTTRTKVRIHFDNFSSKWDETYTIDQFKSGKVRPLYSHATPRPKPTEFMVHHRFIDKTSDTKGLFGLSFLLCCQNEWSTARAGAHILAQASRYIHKANMEHRGPVDVDDINEMDSKVIRMYDKVQHAISELIDLLLDCDRSYNQAALGIGSEGPQESDTLTNPTFDPSSLSAILVKKVGALLHRLPFEIKVCTADSLLANASGTVAEEVPFPFSLMRTIGNYMNARHAVVLHWRDPPIDKKIKPASSVPVMYVHPSVAIHRSSSELLSEGSGRHSASNPGSGGLHLGVCLTEFCKVNQLHMNDNWKCPRCKDFREGKQNMNLWRLPDLLTFHIKRFNCSARWREKITTKVNFPLTGLDMSEWCHAESPAMQHVDSQIYDLIAVVNHYGGMTGGHYVATCKATPCGPYGSEEVAYQFNGAGASSVLAEDDIMGSSPSAGWRFRKDKDTVNQHKVNAALASRNVSDSSEPLWLQFDDDLVEPIPPRNVVSEMAYVLFYRRRRMTPANVAKYCTLE